MSNETIFIDFFQSVANLPGSKSNSKNIDPKSESSFARFFYNETIFNDFSANFPAKGLLAHKGGNCSLMFCCQRWSLTPEIIPICIFFNSTV